MCRILRIEIDQIGLIRVSEKIERKILWVFSFYKWVYLTESGDEYKTDKDKMFLKSRVSNGAIESAERFVSRLGSI